MDRRTFVLSAAACSALAWEGAQARPTWIRLGSRTVRWASTHETITPVGKTGPISALEFRTRRSPIFITTVDVAFDHGSERLAVNEFIRSNWHSRRLELRNRDREIRRVEFGFRPADNARTTSALVELFGRRA